MPDTGDGFVSFVQVGANQAGTLVGVSECENCDCYDCDGGNCEECDNN